MSAPAKEARAAGSPYITDAELSARLTAAKANPERAWLGGMSAVVLQQALADLNAAYRNFFASIKGARKGPKVRPPRCVHPIDVAVGSGRLALWVLGACYLAVVLDSWPLPSVRVLPWQDCDVLTLAEMSQVMDCASVCPCRRCCCRERCWAGFPWRKAAAGHRGSTRPRILRFP